jgi:Major Facilitator Superfamily.
VSLIEAALYFGVGTLQAYLPLYAQDQHIPILKIGFLFGAQGIASILFRPVFGMASDRVGRRPFVVAGIGLCATVLATIPYMGQFLPLLGLSTLFGLGTAMVTPATTAMIGDIVRSRDSVRPWAYSVVYGMRDMPVVH